MNCSAVRMCMPRIPVEKMVKVLKALVYLEKDWVPQRRRSDASISGRR